MGGSAGDERERGPWTRGVMTKPSDDKGTRRVMTSPSYDNKGSRVMTKPTNAEGNRL